MTVKRIDVDRLREVLAYEPDSGTFTWRLSLSPRCRVGGVAGSKQSDGYVVVRLDRVLYKAHRLAYAYAHGNMPEELQIDHVNGDKADNRLVNLRAVTQSQNQQNQRQKRADNTTGVRGVSRYGSKYRAEIVVNGERKIFGVCETLNDAAILRMQAERRLHPFSPMNA